MGVLTHLDKFKDVKRLRKTKQRLKHRFWTEIKEGVKLFYLSGLIHGKYPKREIHNLARFISVMKYHPLSWRVAHPYLLVDRFEDVTNKKCDRNIILYGYLHGCNMKNATKVGKDHDVGETLVRTLQNTRYSIDEKLEQSFINLFGIKPSKMRDDSEDDGNYLAWKHNDRLGSTDIEENEDIEGRDVSKEIEPEDPDEGSEYESEDNLNEIRQQNSFDYDMKGEAEFHNGRMRRKVISIKDEDIKVLRLEILFLPN
ncbi:hypothetical protein AXF42_Ash003867 [Apostasia shenzhenica]|uniref:AARP2CN domain-containing protein n=1 Tax=Apostasia shenzhenica TaxID=1088818 RepID=A0A2I0AI63_9ASPA|nr:hypothetical protein AXF42_Ash003867 [Apostasia shenzhenica]